MVHVILKKMLHGLCGSFFFNNFAMNKCTFVRI